MTPQDYILTVSTALAASKKQGYFPTYFGGRFGEQGEITELFQKILICGVADILAGNIVEIGAAEGKASGALAEIARKNGKQLLVVDPYNGQQEGTEALYGQFQAVARQYEGVLTHRRDSSLSVESIEAICASGPSFVFVDGLHEEWAAYSDIRAAYTALPIGGVVCVDDTNFLRKDAGAALVRALPLGLKLVEIPETVEKILYTYKSWHFAVKIS